MNNQNHGIKPVTQDTPSDSSTESLMQTLQDQQDQFDQENEEALKNLDVMGAFRKMWAREKLERESLKQGK
jgi:hypothetical protein